MNKKNVLSFFNSGVSLFINLKQGIRLFVCSNILFIVGMVCGFLLGRKETLIISLMMISVFVISFFSLILLPRKNVLKANMISETIMFVELYINTILFGSILCIMNLYGIQYIILLVPSMVLIVSYLFITYRNLKGNLELSEKKSPIRTIRLFAFLGGIGGMYFAKLLSNVASEEIAVDIILICLTLLSCFFSIPICKNFIKLKLFMQFTELEQEEISRLNLNNHSDLSQQ